MSSNSSKRNAPPSEWDGASGHRVHVADLATGTTKREVERVFSKYGPMNEVFVASKPPCFAFINYIYRNDAARAIHELDGTVVGSSRVGVSWARERVHGGSARRGRDGPYDSWPSRGKRSRSRSRDNSRRQKRRHSRSRSHDRPRRRSGSPRDRKHSRRTSKEKNGNNRKSKTSENQSRDTEITDENNTHNRSPLTVDDEQDS